MRLSTQRALGGDCRYAGTSAQGGKYRRLAARRGPQKALVAVEHAMLTAIWHMITNGVSYADLGGDCYTRRNPDKAKNRAIDELRRLGYTVTLAPLQPAVPG